MFDITPDDIAILSDEQLRTLVGRLCEAELRRLGYSPAAVTWGGNQNAADGGLDVRVSLPTDKTISGFIPRNATGFQVKKQDMPRKVILKEMRPKGVLRSKIHELADNKGAYIIVSSKGSIADIALDQRRKAMMEATKDLPNTDQMALDFYDRTRLASWVRDHAGLIVWVRHCIGRAISGWEPFGAWAYPADGIEGDYLIDNGVRIRPRPTNTNETLPTIAGLERIREILGQSKSAVRLVGLSGVGKTRLVQALFDGRIGSAALNPLLAIYTNMNDGPDPQPVSLASDLIATSARAILIVDNCASELHARLNSIVKKPSSDLSVLTVEYDIREDQPEGTEVFEVQVASIELIDKLLRQRFPRVSQIDSRTAAEFSGGNARIAVALAETVAKNGTLDRLTEDQLFHRLFVQRQGKDDYLLEIAQACSLVYSFNGDDLTDGEEGELARLAKMVDSTADRVYRAVAELLRRDLAQKRGAWRAILPQAIANRLATTALQNIPCTRIEAALFYGTSGRLLKSFSRRLGYLHSSEEAVDLVCKWLDKGGWISEVWNLNGFGEAVFQNILPTAPEAGLRAIERGLPAHDPSKPISTGKYLVRALRSIAYEATLFNRCVDVLQTLAISGDEDISKAASEVHKSLFPIYLSGTHASLDQRAGVVTKLLRSAEPVARKLGLAALNAMLKAMHFSSDSDFHFGARSRDFGYQSRTYQEKMHWYRTVFVLAEEIAFSNCLVAEAVKSELAGDFRQLWSIVGLKDELEMAFVKLGTQSFFREGWLAVKKTRHYDEKDKTSENYARLSKLEGALRPNDLVQRVRGCVLISKHNFDDFELGSPGGYQAAVERKEKEALALGEEVASDPASFSKLLSEIVSPRGRFLHFGMGLARRTGSSKALWQRLSEEFAITAQRDRDLTVFLGVLCEWSMSYPGLASEVLDEALESGPLAPYFPILQSAVALDQRGMERLARSLELGKVTAQMYSNLALGRATDKVAIADLAKFIVALAQAPDGLNTAIDLLHMQLWGDKHGKREHAPELMAAGRDLLTRVKFNREKQPEDFHLETLVTECLSSDEGDAATKLICQNLMQVIKARDIYGFDYGQFISGLFKTRPMAVLDEFFYDRNSDITLVSRALGEIIHAQNPIDQVSDAQLLKWSQRNPVERFPALATVVSAFGVSPDHNPSSWMPIASILVHNAPDAVAVMRAFAQRLRPIMGGESRATILEANAKLLDAFETRADLNLITFIENEKASLLREAALERERETQRAKSRDERFE